MGTRLSRDNSLHLDILKGQCFTLQLYFCPFLPVPEFGGEPPSQTTVPGGHLRLTCLGLKWGQQTQLLSELKQHMTANPRDVYITGVSTARMGELEGSILKDPKTHTRSDPSPSWLLLLGLRHLGPEDAPSPSCSLPNLNCWLVSSPCTLSGGILFSSSGDWIWVHQGLISCLKSFLGEMQHLGSCGRIEREVGLGLMTELHLPYTI